MSKVLERRKLISIIKTLMNKEQFDLIKHYQACIEKSTIPITYKIEIVEGNCKIISSEWCMDLSSFLKENKTFIILYEIINLFKGRVKFSDLDTEFKKIIGEMETPSKRSIICLEQLFRTQKEMIVKNAKTLKKNK